MNRTIYHLEYKRTKEHHYAFNLTILLKNNMVGTSLASLRNHDFKVPFENNICIIRFSEIINSKRGSSKDKFQIVK